MLIIQAMGLERKLKAYKVLLPAYKVLLPIVIDSKLNTGKRQNKKKKKKKKKKRKKIVNVENTFTVYLHKHYVIIIKATC